MDHELAVALKDLGFSPTEAEIYVAMLEQSQAGPVSAYKIAQDMGRDPANMTKTLGAMAKRGALRASSGKPRLYTPVSAIVLTGERVARLKQAGKLLEEIGSPPDDESLRPLESTEAALALARRLLGDARRIVLVDAAPELLGDLAGDLSRLAEEEGASVLVRSTAAVSIPRVRVWVDPEVETLAPGPWLRLAIDGHRYLEIVVHPERRDELLHGHWSCNPSQTFLGHRNIGAELILADVLEMLRDGAGSELVRRRAEDQTALIMRQISWRQRWREAGLADYTPEVEEVTELAAEDLAEAMAEVAAEAPLQSMAAAAGSVQDVEPEETSPLKFIFRRRKKS